MALTAIRPEIPFMDIIPLVACDAVPLARLVLHRTTVTTAAMHALMGALQREVTVLVVIEFPDQPVIGVVAAHTVFAQCFFMHIIVGMTVLATTVLHLKGQGLVAGLAARRGVLTNERERGQVVVETNLFVPVLLAVTGLAFSAQLLFMHILVLVAGQAFLRRLVPRLAGPVARLATGSAVRAPQGKIRLPIMIELGLQPALRIMALVTSLAVAALVHIVQLVAADALSRLAAPGLVSLDQ